MNEKNEWMQYIGCERSVSNNHEESAAIVREVQANKSLRSEQDLRRKRMHSKKKNKTS